MEQQLVVIGMIFLFVFVGLSGCEEVPEEIVAEMTISSFTVEPSIIKPGETANLSWIVTGSKTTVWIDNEIGNVSLTGNRIISPNKNTTYRLIARNTTSTKIATVLIIVGNTSVKNESNGNGGVENPIAVIDTTSGVITVELYQDKVPNTCDNFIKLANDDFYENLIFHRVIDDFMIQGGGYFGDGTRKESPYGPIDLEIHPDVRHVDGAIAMARTSDPNSATSQFYICDGAQSFLDDNYAAFGKVIEGMNVVRGIATVPTTSKYGAQDWPVYDIIINSITIEIS
jgi:peptidyl-prolyl cis-trans isomerase A (cyclophilin A)